MTGFTNVSGTFCSSTSTSVCDVYLLGSFREIA